MGFGGKAWWALALPAGLVMALSGPASGQQGVPERAAAPQPAATETAAPQPATTEPAAAGAPAGAPAADAAPSAPTDLLSSGRLMNGPSLRETGRIAVAPAPMPMTMIENEGTPKSPNEKSIARAASSLEPVPVKPRGVIDQRVLDREIGERFADISDCRIEVARSKQVPPPQVVADRLLLRWIIQPDGTTGPTDVVATAPVDLAVMDCAKRVMSQWTFTRPRGGAMAVERPFTF
jgi:hypothetical protein